MYRILLSKFINKYNKKVINEWKSHFYKPMFSTSSYIYCRISLKVRKSVIINNKVIIRLFNIEITVVWTSCNLYHSYKLSNTIQTINKPAHMIWSKQLILMLNRYTTTVILTGLRHRSCYMWPRCSYTISVIAFQFIITDLYYRCHWCD